MTNGDMNADEVYNDREMLNRLGYGIFDVNFGKSGVGFENVKDFSYVVAQDEDPKLYRRKVFIGIRAAALDYFRRLNLLQEAETGREE